MSYQVKTTVESDIYICNNSPFHLQARRNMTPQQRAFEPETAPSRRLRPTTESKPRETVAQEAAGPATGVATGVDFWTLAHL